ncbi:MAG: hypothetical protein ABI977_03590, partial [Acidobacteriota bacterium]
MSRIIRFFSASITLSALIAMVAILFHVPAHAQATLKLLGQLDPFDGGNRYADVWGEGNYAYLASFNGTGVMIIDISNPSAPKLAGYYNDAPETGRFVDVVVINGIGYFASEINRGGLRIVDVRDPAHPVLLSQINTDKNGFANVHEEFVTPDGILYEVDSRTSVVKVFDVRDPRNPVFVRDIQTTDTQFIHAIVVVNGRLYTSGWSGKTDIYDIRNVLTQAPPLLGVVESGTRSHASWPSSDGRLLASAREIGNGDVRLFDISNPANPVQIASITAQSLGLVGYSPHNPYILGNLLFVSWYQAGLVVIDITNPRQPRLTGVYDTYNGSVNDSFAGCWGTYPFLGLDKVLLSDMDGGLFVVDATADLVGPRTVSAANYSFSSIAAKSIVAAFGSNLASATQVATTQPLPTLLAGTSVQVQDSLGELRSAPLFFVSPNQINYQIPADTAPGAATVYVTNGSANTQVGTTIIAASALSIFTQDQSGNGAAVALDAFTFTPPPFNATQLNGQPNIIAVFGTGLGNDATNGNDSTNVDVNVGASVQATIDGQPVMVSYAGRAPGFVGLNQLNIAFPAGLA